MAKSIENLATVTRIGLDLAKNVFQLHAVDAAGAVIVARSVRRGALLRYFDKLPRCLVAMEACASAHHWGRALVALGFTVKLIPPAYVKPSIKDSGTGVPVLRVTAELLTFSSKQSLLPGLGG